MPTARLHRTRRAVSLALAALLLGACESAEQPTVQPETWRRYNLVRLDTSALPTMWGISGADTQYVVAGTIDFRVDGTAATIGDFRMNGRPDTLSSLSFSTYTLGPDSLFWGTVRVALRDTSLVIGSRVPRGRASHYRLDPTSRLAP